MTWKGFFVKNKSNDGQVEVSSENDIRILSNSSQGLKERIKIGRLSGTGDPADQYVYGIRISDKNGSPVIENDAEGALWLKNMLTVGNGETSTVAIGYNPASGSNFIHDNAHEIIHAGSRNGDKEFVVYEDGYLKAAGGTFTGTIYATGGKIGNMTIDEVEQSVYKVIIESDSGTIFKNGQGTKVLTAKLYEGDHEVTADSLTYVWFKNDVQLSYSTKQISVTADSTDAVYTYTCRITYNPANT